MFFQHFNPIQRWWPAPDTASDAPEEEKPRGLIGWIQRFEREDEEAAPPQGLTGWMLRSEDERDLGRALAPLAVPGMYVAKSLHDAAQSPLGRFVGGVLANPSGVAPPTIDPVTGELNLRRYAENSGHFLSGNMPLPDGFGLGLPPTASAPVTAMRRPLPAPFPGTKPFEAEGDAYAVRHTGDEEFGPVWETDSWDEAVELLKREQRGEVRGQVRHDDIGGIAVPWGVEGTGKGDGYGLAKLGRFHSEVVDNLPTTVANMHVVTESPNRYRLENDTHYAVVSRNYKGRQREPWVLSAYEKK